jgi:hypothetical protein
MIVPIITANNKKEKDDKNDDSSFSTVIGYPSCVSALNKDGIFKDVDRNAFCTKNILDQVNTFYGNNTPCI